MTMKLSDFKRAFQYKLAESDPGTGLGKSGFNEKMVESAVTEAGERTDVNYRHCIHYTRSIRVSQSWFINYSYRFIQLITNSGALRLKMSWPKNSDYAEEPVFACWRKGDSMDGIRHELLMTFAEMGRVQGTDIFPRSLC